jgi:hypothetical protein
VLDIQSQAKATIVRRNTSKIESGTYHIPHNNINFNTGKINADPVLVITADGDVIWNGKPSEAAKTLVRSFQFAVEKQNNITNAARRRYYLQACENLLKAAEQMEYEEFIAFLNKQVYNREHTVIMDALQGNN